MLNGALYMVTYGVKCVNVQFWIRRGELRHEQVKIRTAHSRKELKYPDKAKKIVEFTSFMVFFFTK